MPLRSERAEERIEVERLKDGFWRVVLRYGFIEEPNIPEALAHCAAGNPQEGEDKSFAASLMEGVVYRMTPTDAFKDKGYGYQPPEHWQDIHDSAVASGALEKPLPDLAAVYTNEFVAGWNA